MFIFRRNPVLLQGEPGSGGTGDPPAAPPAPPAGAAAPPQPPADPPPAGDPPAGDPPAAGDPPEPPEEKIVFRSSEQLKARLEQAKRSELQRLFGTDDEEELKALLKLREQEEERKRQEMSERERLEADLQAAEAAKAAAEEERDWAQYEAHVNSVCAKLGVTNVDYALYTVAQAAESVPEGEQLDVEEYLAKELEDERKAAAYGQATPPSTEGVPAKTTTGQGPPPATPPPAGDKTAMDMDDAEWRARKAALGIGIGP